MDVDSVTSSSPPKDAETEGKQSLIEYLKKNGEIEQEAADKDERESLSTSSKTLSIDHDPENECSPASKAANTTKCTSHILCNRAWKSDDGFVSFVKEPRR